MISFCQIYVVPCEYRSGNGEQKATKNDEFIASSMIGCGQNNHAPDLLNFVLIFAGEDFQFGQGPYHQHTSRVFFVE